jgi:Phage integrase family
VETLARAAEDDQDAALFRIAAFTDLRLGELRALRWSDVDFGLRLVHVRRNYTRGVEGSPKSGRDRSVPLIDQLRRRSMRSAAASGSRTKTTSPSSMRSAPRGRLAAPDSRPCYRLSPIASARSWHDQGVPIGEREWWKGDVAFVVVILALVILGLLAELFGRFEVAVAVFVVVAVGALYRSRFGL